MNYPIFREEIKDYYWNKANDKAKAFFEKCTNILDANAKENMSSYEMKAFQYKTISENLEPVLFYNSPFYYETGALAAHCDGARDFRGHSHAGGWTFRKNFHLFIDQDKELWARRQKQFNECFYLIGPYHDTDQHFGFNHRPIFESGIKGVYEKAEEALKKAETDEEKSFLTTMMQGLLSLKRISEKFAEKAQILADAAPDEKAKDNMLKICEAAKRTPWEKPQSFYEALNCLAFFRKALGTLEGIGFSSFGRVDMDLYPFYKKDIESGVLTEEEAYELIAKFLITFDLHYDHDMKMVMYADHELENTYVLGGCNPDGTPLYNELTKMFLKANREEKIIYPKIKCRYSKNSPKEYFDEINISVIKGTSTILYQNDDAVIPALIRAGRTVEEARDYVVSGCWDLYCAGVEKYDSGSYVNMLKPFEYSLHKLDSKMQEVGMTFKPIDEAGSFEEVYKITLENINLLFEERQKIVCKGGKIWNKVDPLTLFSSTLKGCLEKRTDYTAGGAKYIDDHFMCFGFPNIVDSLLVIKTLCFDKKKYTLGQLLEAVRNNWEGYEDMRTEALHCKGWGDGSHESCELANRFNNDLFCLTKKLTGSFGGKVHLGYLTYTEIRWWGEKTLATPDGRHNGEYFAQGLTPSRLKKIPYATSVINSMANIDASTIAGNSVVNFILPSDKITLDLCEAFLRATADSAIMSLQLNCTTKEQLLDAQKHPEKYPDLIVRVTGFSAKFTSLSPEWQQEVLTRNFYE